MKKYGERSQTPAAFLVEIIIVILFFALSAATVLTLFSHAEKISDRAEEQSLAMFTAASIAEDVRTAQDMEAALLAACPGIQQEEGRYLLALNDEMMPEENGAYRLAVTLTRENTGAGILQKADIAILREAGEEVYSLTAAGYVHEEVRP